VSERLVSESAFLPLYLSDLNPDGIGSDSRLELTTPCEVRGSDSLYIAGFLAYWWCGYENSWWHRWELSGGVARIVRGNIPEIFYICSLVLTRKFVLIMLFTIRVLKSRSEEVSISAPNIKSLFWVFVHND